MSWSFGQSIDIVNIQKDAGLLDPFFQVDAESYITNVASGNTLFINQVGLNNKAFVNVTSSKSNVDVSQFGRDNLADLSYTGNNIQAMVKQNGENNLVTDYVFFAQDGLNTEITQTGTNLNVVKFGANSITNGLKINMTGSDKTIVLNSFN
tara:strand:+ start:650 stop:1102 length:453 start_codon:yes stop_codon:yes gene_type:complete